MEAFLGALEFQENEYEELKELYESLKTKQKPHTLFISCVDSRVVPNLITGTKPGELYVIRNMGNVIPPKTSHKESLSAIAGIAIVGLAGAFIQLMMKPPKLKPLTLQTGYNS